MSQISNCHGLQEPFHALDAFHRSAPVGMRRSCLRKALPPDGSLSGDWRDPRSPIGEHSGRRGLSFCHRQFLI
jgi:hypothetical protein